VIREALHACPWVLDELKARADRLHALAGAFAGPLGTLSELQRGGLLPSLAVRSCEPNEVVVALGQAKIGFLLVGAGAIELADAPGAPASSVVLPGRCVLLRAASSGQPASHVARAGADGALLLTGDETALEAVRDDSALLASLSSVE
jgi:hypothetical protein